MSTREPKNPLDSLYQEVILDHYRSPHNFGLLTLDKGTAQIHQENPSCGDQIDLQVQVEDGRIQTIRFQGKGCAISQASASMMTDQVRGKTVEEARTILAAFQAMLFSKDYDPEILGDLEALEGVRKFPVRTKCATLAWHCLQTLLDELASPVSEKSV